MGLDVTAYSSAKLVRDDSDKDYDGYDDGLSFLYDNDSFPGRADDFVTGWYETEGGYDFRAGGYGSYNHWREELAKLSGWPEGSYEQYGRTYSSHAASAWAATEGPFWELINFTDCDGAIGPKVAAKLAKDFADYQGKADAYPDADFSETYSKFREAFETAAKGGFVRFH